MGLLTQQDPIGIAGGLNLYGYANGDPVNFSDPFGLDPCEGLWVEEPETVEDWESRHDWVMCKLGQYAGEDEAAARAAIQLAGRAELGECIASAVLTGQAVFADALVVAAGATVLKAAHAAFRGPVWAAGVAWGEAGIVASTGDRAALATGRGAVRGTQELAGGNRPSGLVSNLFATPRAKRRSDVACSR